MGELEHFNEDNGELVRRCERTGQCLRHSKKTTSKTYCTGEDHFFKKKLKTLLTKSQQKVLKIREMNTNPNTDRV